jgi:hypothetical protein
MSPPLRPLLTVLAVAGLTASGGVGDAAAIGTVSIDGTTLVSTGDDTREFAVIDKEPIRDENGTTVWGRIFGR